MAQIMTQDRSEKSCVEVQSHEIDVDAMSSPELEEFLASKGPISNLPTPPLQAPPQRRTSLPTRSKETDVDKMDSSEQKRHLQSQCSVSNPTTPPRQNHVQKSNLPRPPTDAEVENMSTPELDEYLATLGPLYPLRKARPFPKRPKRPPTDAEVDNMSTPELDKYLDTLSPLSKARRYHDRPKTPPRDIDVDNMSTPELDKYLATLSPLSKARRYHDRPKTPSRDIDVDNLSTPELDKYLATLGPLYPLHQVRRFPNRPDTTSMDDPPPPTPPIPAPQSSSYPLATHFLSLASISETPPETPLNSLDALLHSFTKPMDILALTSLILRTLTRKFKTAWKKELEYIRYGPRPSYIRKPLCKPEALILAALLTANTFFDDLNWSPGNAVKELTRATGSFVVGVRDLDAAQRCLWRHIDYSVLRFFPDLENETGLLWSLMDPATAAAVGPSRAGGLVEAKQRGGCYQQIGTATVDEGIVTPEVSPEADFDGLSEGHGATVPMAEVSLRIKVQITSDDVGFRVEEWFPRYDNAV
ncbi:hypothetical protein K402DRAFT_388041 [Aulographum hederae CBS 113979]|uniref:Uncharacterized protein n=1 Tax=Aulographum hederae CBS 113979 TaxID=1176131 RepID=A0A6G1HH26_9PEZI|nr:hypothetical protein K402DRAFT_388041 [Aulographum hederae CBS 113979]